MFVAISNKGITNKPQNVGSFLNNVVFKNMDITGSQFMNLCENGFTFKPLLKDETKKSLLNNIAGIQLIVVDIDECNLNASEILDKFVIKPTAYQSSFSHKTEKKGYKNCYHFYFVLNECISEEQYPIAYNNVIKGVEDIIDNRATNAARMFFTNNKCNDNFEFNWCGQVINATAIASNGLVAIIDNVEANTAKVDGDIITYMSNSFDTKTGRHSMQHTYTTSKNNAFGLDKDFFNDFYAMGRGEFLSKWELKCRVNTETSIPAENWVFGKGDHKMYADLRNIDFYQVPTTKYVWDKESKSGKIMKVKQGNRNMMLFLDAITFNKTNENITKEQMVYGLASEVFKHFEISADYEVSKDAIIKKAMEVWDKKDSYNVKKESKVLKLNMKYYRGIGINDPLDAYKVAKKHLYGSEIGEYYDCGMTIEDNLKVMWENGLKTKKTTLIKWCEDNGIDYICMKDARKAAIEQIIINNPDKSSRELEAICKENNIETSYKTIQRMKKNMTTQAEKEIVIEDTLDVNTLEVSTEVSETMTAEEAKKVVFELYGKDFAIEPKEIVEYLNEVHKFYGFEEADVVKIIDSMWDSL